MEFMLTPFKMDLWRLIWYHPWSSENLQLSMVLREHHRWDEMPSLNNLKEGLLFGLPISELMLDWVCGEAECCGRSYIAVPGRWGNRKQPSTQSPPQGHALTSSHSTQHS